MRNLLFASLLGGSLLAGCASVRSGCRYEGESAILSFGWQGIVNPSEGVNKFNLQIDIARQHFSGLLWVKQLDNYQYRTVFTTHFGLRVFDLEFIADSLVVHYCMEPVRKEKIIRLLKNDLSRLWGEKKKETMVKVYKDKETGGEKVQVYQVSPRLFYRKNQKAHTLESITSGRGWRKTSWIFRDFDEGYPSKIVIRHAVWPIRLELDRLDEK